MTTPPPTAVLLLDRGLGGDASVAAWREMLERDGAPAEVFVVTAVPGGAEWSPALGDLDLGDAELALVAELGTVPGPDLLTRMHDVRATDPGAIVDARVLPVETSRILEDARDAHDPGEPGDPWETAAQAVRIAELAPTLRVSGWCFLLPVAALEAVGGVWESIVDGDRGETLRALGAETGHDVVVAPTATVFLDVRLDAEGFPIVNGPVDAAADAFAPPTNLHPAALPATSLSTVLATVGVDWTTDTEDPDAGRPFLTVVTRTQGERPRCLEEMLTCLSGQSDRDFEALVICHRVTPEALSSTRAIIDNLPGWLRERVRVLQTQRPGRAAPLNDGFAAARGRYIAVLDDDDTVFASWVSTFAALEREAPGRLLRAATLRQDVIPLPDHEHLCPVPVGNAYRDWPPVFELVDHLRANYSPCMSMAFPRGVFHDLAFRFDESLDTTEDWDFVVRASGIVGASSSPEVTSVYRWWLDQASSRAVHSKAEWEDAHRRVLAKIDESVILLPPGAAKKFRETTNAGWEEAAALATSQHLVILELNKTAAAHDKAVELWQAAEARANNASERAKKWREKLVKRSTRFEERLGLMREADELLRRTTPSSRPGTVFDMSIAELRSVVHELREEPDRGSLGRLAARFRR